MLTLTVCGTLALVTGGTRGIGLASARALAESGVDVVLVGRDRAELDSAAEGLRASGRTIHAEAFDLVQTDRIADWFADLCARIGTPDILVNAAGLSRRGPAVELTLEDWHTVMTVNTTAIWALAL